MNKLNFLIKLYYPVNGLFNKVLPKIRLFIFLQSYLLNLIDSKRHTLISNKAHKEVELLLKTKHKKLILIWDCLTTPVTYGDFVDYCMFARYLRSAGYEIHFYIAADQFRLDWQNTYPDETIRIRFLNELKDVGNFILDVDLIQICNFEDINFSSELYIPFSKEILARSDYHILKYAEVMTEILQIKYPSKNYLIQSSDVINLIKEEDYIAWHIRGSSINSCSEDENPEDIISFYNIITSLTNLPIVIISSRGALTGLKKLLGHKENIILSKDRFDDFLSDAKIIMASKMFIQCGWGGTFLLSASSDVPYLGPPIERAYAPWQEFKIHVRNQQLKPWANENQLTFDGFDDFNQKLSEILIKIL